MYMEQLNELQAQVESLQHTMQQLAAQQLADSYFHGSLPSAKEETAQVKLDLGGILSGHSFAIQVSRSELPYASWVFLQELSKGEWILRSKDQWLEIAMASSREKEVRYVRQSMPPSNTEYESFNHLESSIDVDRRFVVGLRNPMEGEMGVVISIYMERGMCGNYENEACFGIVSDGFSSLNAVTELRKVVPINAISVQA